MPCCFVPGCKTGYHSSFKKNKNKDVRNFSLFKARTDEMLMKWREMIAREDKVLSKKDAVCELHFEEHLIERYYVTKMPDGTVSKIERGFPKLSASAVPTLFGAEANDAKKRKMCASSENDVVDEPVIKKLKEETEDVHTPINTIFIKEELNDHVELLDEAVQLRDEAETQPQSLDPFTLIGNALDTIRLPSTYWFRSRMPSGDGITTSVGFGCWSTDLKSIDKRLVLNADTTFKIHILDKEVSVDVSQVTNVEHLNELLFYAHSLFVCVGADLESRAPDCCGYINAKQLGRPGPVIRRCEACRRFRYNSKRRKEKNSETINGYAKIRNAHKRIKRLQIRVAKLKERLQGQRGKCAKHVDHARASTSFE